MSFCDRIIDVVLGAKDWSVVDDGGDYPCIYAVPTHRVVRSDHVIVTGLRERAAFREAKELRPYYAEPVFGCRKPADGGA